MQGAPCSAEPRNTQIGVRCVDGDKPFGTTTPCGTQATTIGFIKTTCTAAEFNRNGGCICGFLKVPPCTVVVRMAMKCGISSDTEYAYLNVVSTCRRISVNITILTLATPAGGCVSLRHNSHIRVHRTSDERQSSCHTNHPILFRSLALSLFSRCLVCLSTCSLVRLFACSLILSRATSRAPSNWKYFGRKHLPKWELWKIS